MVNSEHEKFL